MAVHVVRGGDGAGDDYVGWRWGAGRSGELDMVCGAPGEAPGWFAAVDVVPV